MGEELGEKKKEEEDLGDQGKKKEEEKVDPIIKLTELVGKLAERIESGGKQKEEKGSDAEVDRLLKEIEGSGAITETDKETGEKETVNLEDFTPTQLANFLVKHIGESMIQPLYDRLEVIRVQGEIRDFNREYGKDTFDKYKKAIWAVATKNPNMSVEDAYLYVKGRESTIKKEDKKGEEGGDKKKGEEDKGKSTVKKLEDLRKGKTSIGEKGGVSSHSAEEGEAKTTREAASRAVREILGQD